MSHTGGVESPWKCRIAVTIVAGLGTIASGASQLDSPVEIVEVGSTGDYREVVRGQQVRDGQLLLTPDSCFFFPTGPDLTGQQPSSLPGAEFNGGNSFAAIEDIRHPGQLIQWPILPIHDGTWNIEVFIDTPDSGVELIVRLGDVEHAVTTVASDGTTPQPWSLTASVTGAGATTASIRWFELQLVELHGAASLGRVLKVRLSGPSMTDDYLLRARWRPAAIHGSFRSSSFDATGLASDLFVMEQVADHSSPTSLDFYSPISTSFGYYGSVFDKVPGDPDGRFTASSPNFSMWNYGRDADPPPLPQFSHLLALGHPDLIFGGFNHEGTGVKPRTGPQGGWPLAGTPLDSFVSALAYQPADADEVHPFTRYTGSFWDPGEQRWRLYAVGNKQGVESFRLPSSFIEVPGPPTRQRTGHIVRRMLYRGWIRDTAGGWHLIDSQTVGAGPGDIVNKIWDATPDGWLTRAMGGIVHREYLQSGRLVSVSPPAEVPAYMEEAFVGQLDAAPAGVTLERIVGRADGTLEIRFTLSGHAAPAEVLLYHGDHDGLTLIFEDGNQPDEWSGTISLGTFSNGTHSVSLARDGLPADGHARLLVESDGLGRFWSHRTAQWFAPVEAGALPVGTPAGAAVGQVTIDNPTPRRGVSYSLVDGNGDGLFVLDPDTGVLTLARDTDSTDAGQHTVTIAADLDGWSNRVPARAVEVGMVAPPETHTLALFDFTPDEGSGEIADEDGSEALAWSTSGLIDQATGNGALGSGNQSSNNRRWVTTPVAHLRLSSNRESDAQTPLMDGGNGESTWFTFSVTPDAGQVLDFSAAAMALDTFAMSTLSGTTGARWTVHFRRDGEAAWKALDTLQGAVVDGSGSAGPIPLRWMLTPVGRCAGAVHFIIDPETTGFATNGVANQRGIGFGNVGIAGVCEPALDFVSWSARHGFAGLDPDSDGDKDRIAAVLEYALGLDPARSDPTPGEFDGNSLIFRKGPDAAAAGLIYQIQTSSDLGQVDPWTPVAPAIEDLHLIRHNLPTGLSSHFARLVVTLP